jgi:hypothetical protein
MSVLGIGLAYRGSGCSNYSSTIRVDRFYSSFRPANGAVRSASKRYPLLDSTNGSNDPKTNRGDRFRPQLILGSTRWVRHDVSMKRQAEERRRCVFAAPCCRRRRGASQRQGRRKGWRRYAIDEGRDAAFDAELVHGRPLPNGHKVVGDLHGRFDGARQPVGPIEDVGYERLLEHVERGCRPLKVLCFVLVISDNA